MADTALARELALYAANDYQIYKSRIEPFILNYAAKKVRSVYNWRDFSTGRPPVMDAATKTAFGREMLDEMESEIDYVAAEIKSGKRDKLGRKKNPSRGGVGKQRRLHTGGRGGRYYVRKGRKVYV